jgi:DNA primase|tara:strand:+ start:31 stop:942 length:912 start_codon:yes stop_codon:yes gene_type:complete
MEKIVNLLDRVINSKGYKLKKANEYLWYCPFHSHHKPKLQINIQTQKWHCWVCDAKGRKLYQLFKKVSTPNKYFEELNEIYDDYVSYEKVQKSGKLTGLPKEFFPLWRQSESPIYRQARSFLSRRGIHYTDILKYNIGYCDRGIYTNRVVIPSYNENGDLNYFVGRDIYGSKFKYKNPPVSRDIIGFDFYINWDEPIVLCEGPFDAIAIKRNAIPLFGKVILPKLKKKIYEKKVKEIYVVLDKDARKDSIKIVDEFMREDINVYFVELSDKDPSDLGFNRCIDLIKRTHKTEFLDLIKHKLLW